MATFSPGDAYEVRKPMQVYWDSPSARAQKETHGGQMLSPRVVYIDGAYREDLLPAIPVRTEAAPLGYVLGWLNINENDNLTVWLGLPSGKTVRAKAVYVGDAGGVPRKAKAAFVRDAGGTVRKSR